MRKCVDVAGSQSFHYGKKTHRYEMLRGRREPFGKGLELEVLVRTQDFMGFPGRSVGKKIRLQCRKPWLDSWVWKILCRRDRLPAPVFLGFPCGSAGKESAHNAGDLGLIPWRRERLPTPVFWPGEFHGLYSPSIAKSRTRLSNFHFHFQDFIDTCVYIYIYMYLDMYVCEYIGMQVYVDRCPSSFY